MSKKPMANIPPFGLRMQPDLKARIETAAASNNRSMNAEIVSALEEKYPAPEPIFQAIFDLYHLHAAGLIGDNDIKGLPVISRRILDSWIRMSLFEDENVKGEKNKRELLRSSVEQIMHKRNLNDPSDVQKFIASIRDPDLSGFLEDQE